MVLWLTSFREGHQFFIDSAQNEILHSRKIIYDKFVNETYTILSLIAVNIESYMG